MQWLKKKGNVKALIGFLLIALGVFFFTLGIDPQSDSLADLFSRFSFPRALLNAVLVLLTFNWAQLLALVIGLIAWKLDNNAAGKYVVIGALIVTVMTTVRLLLYSPAGNG